MIKRLRMLAGAALPLAVGASLAVAAPASASTPGCTGLGASCGDNVNVFGNGWDVRGQVAAYNNHIISWPDTTSDPATDFTRISVSFHVYRYQYAPKGHDSGLCVSDPGGADGIVLRTCNSGNFQRFRLGGQGTGGHQLIDVATGKVVTTNGTGRQLTGGGSYAGGSFFTWEGGGVTPVSATASTRVVSDPDSGDHGTWATDTLTRTVSVYEHGAAALTDCAAGATACFLYSGRVNDSGTFAAANGALSPRDGTPIQGPLSGSFSGGGNYSFYASSATPDAGLVPGLHSDGGVAGVAPFTTGTWFKNFFPAGTKFGGTGLLDNWSWTYTTTSPCVSPAQTWVDAASNGGGALSAGDITGSASC